MLLCLATLWLQFARIESTLPYPHHVDEAFISGPAHRTLVTGTLHPYTFNYPSLPKYLASVGMAVGFLRGASHLELAQVQRVGNVGYPYYETRSVMRGARQLFALLSVLTLAATGASAWLAFRRPSAIVLAPLVLVTSPLFFFHSWTYLNIDIVGTCFTMAGTTAWLLGTRRSSLHQSAIVPGVCAGLATASKYTLAITVLPVLLALGFQFTSGRRTWAWAAALTATVVAFIAAVPYSLIDIPSFLNGVASEAFHYASGHRGFSEEPGLPQLLYYGRHFVSDFGAVGVALALVGFSVYARADWRRAAVLASFPAALLWLLSSQRVHFTRNVLSLHPFVAMFAAFGVVSLHGWMRGLAARRTDLSRRSSRAASAMLGVLLVIAVVPLRHVTDHLRGRTDSRNVASTWLLARVPPDWTIVVPTQLGFDTRQLESSGRRVVTVNLQSATDAGSLQSLLTGVPDESVILVPRWGADSRFRGQELADTLNAVSRRWRVLETFGTNEVLVNYSYSTPWGDPAFAVAGLK